MVENSRKDPRAKVLSMTVRYKSATLDEFIEHHSHDVSRGGMYIKTPQPFPPGTLLKFEVKIGSDQRVIQGVGRVVWRRQSDEATESHPAGMGVKFIKLDEESKAVIGQVVSSRPNETSAFDEVVADSDRPPINVSEPPPQPKRAVSGNFFPSSNEDVPAPAPEDRTVMKQAAELLQEALREVASTGDTEPPTPKPEAIQSQKPTRSATTTPAPGNAGNAALPRRGAGAAKQDPVAKDAPNFVSTVPPAAATSQAPRASRPAEVSHPPRASARAASRTGQRESGAPARPRPQHTRSERSETDITSAAAALPTHFEQTPAPRRSGGGAIRSLVMLLLVAGVAGAVFVMTRTAPPPPPPIESAPTTSAAELAPGASVAESAPVSPSAAEIPSATANTEPASTGTATAPAVASSETAPAGSVDQASQATPEAESLPKPVVRPKAPARKKQSVSTDSTTTDDPPTTTPEAAPPKPADTETPKPPADAPTSPGTTSGASTPSPKADTPAPAPQVTDQL